MDNSHPDLPSSPPMDNSTSKAKISVKIKISTSNNSSRDPAEQVVGDGLDASGSSTELQPQSGQLGYRVCEFCGKKFSSGKAWGGHKRHHLKIMRNFKIIEEGSSSSSKKINNMLNKHHHHHHRHHQRRQQYRRCTIIKAGDVTTSGGKPTCCLCGKSFASINSLFGHMRFHPDRDLKGIQTPEEKDPTVDLLSYLPSAWSNRDKRGRICLTDWVPQAAHCLWTLSQDAGNVKNTIGSTIKISRKSIDEEENDQTDEMGIKKKKKLINTSKLKDTEIQTEPYGFRCGNCYRSFLSFQALEGHRSSCPSKDKKNKYSAEIDYGYDDDDAEEICASEPDETEESGEQDHPVVVSMETSFHCDVCDKIFPTGQALGGHKRCHRKAPAKLLSNEVLTGGETSNVASNTASSGEAASQVAEAIQAGHGMLGIDLNKPYIMQDDEDDG